MIKISKQWKIYHTYFFLIALVIIFPVNKIYPCGWGPVPDEYYIFTPQSLSMVYSGEKSNQNQSSCSSSVSAYTGKDSNIREWSSYFGLYETDDHFLVELIYGNNLAEIKTALANLKTPSDEHKEKAIKKSGRLSNNRAFIKAVRDFKVDALKYLIFAKECEKYANISYNPWEEPVPVDSTSMAVLEKRGIEERDNVSDSILKMRYAFQIIRLSHYRNDFKQTINYFKTMKLQNTSALYYRILSLYAGALAHTGELEKARFLFGIIAAKSENYGDKAKIDFKNIPQDENTFQKTLSFAKDTNEKIEIYKIRALTENTISSEDLREVRELKSDSGELETVLLHQVSLIEKNLLNRFFAQRDVYPGAKFENLDKKEKGNSMVHKYSSWNVEEINSLREIRSFIFETLENFNVCSPILWNLAGAYLSLLDEDFDKADYYLKKSESMNNNLASEYLLRKQKELRLMHNLMTGSALDSIHKKDYAAVLNNLYGKGRVENIWSGYQPQMYIHRILKRALLDQGQKDIAQLISDWSGFYLENYNTVELENMLALLEKKEKDPLDLYIVYQSGLELDRVASRLTSWYIRENRLQEAVRLSSRISTSPINLEYVRNENPFSSPLLRTDNPDKKALIWDKKTFASYMLSLQEKIKQETDPRKKSKIYLEMGNGWYNVSHFGSWWIIVDDSWSSYVKEDKYKELLSRAKDSWMKSRELWPDNLELGAEAIYLTVLVEQRIHDFSDIESNERKISNDERKLWENLESKYSETSFFNSTVRECAYYRQFAEQN